MNESQRDSLKGIDRAKLDAIVDPIVRANGGEVVDMEFKPDQGGWVLRVFVEKLGSAAQQLSTELAAVNLELCSDVARELSPALDVADLIPHAYNLEVSSPGVERPLRGPADFVRFAGQKAKLKLHEGIPSKGGASQKVIIGKLDGLTDASGSRGDQAGSQASSGGEGSSPTQVVDVTQNTEPTQHTHLAVTEGSTTYSIPLSDIASARLVFEFGPVPKPGKPGSSPRPGKPGGRPSSKSEPTAERSKRSV